MPRGPSCTERLADVGPATLEWVDWYNHARPDRAYHDLPPAEYEAIHQPDPTQRRKRVTQPPRTPGTAQFVGRHPGGEGSGHLRPIP